MLQRSVIDWMVEKGLATSLTLPHECLRTYLSRLKPFWKGPYSRSNPLELQVYGTVASAFEIVWNDTDAQMTLDGLPRLEDIGGPSLDSDYALNVSLILNPTRSVNEVMDEAVVPSRSKVFNMMLDKGALPSRMTPKPRADVISETRPIQPNKLPKPTPKLGATMAAETQ